MRKALAEAAGDRIDSQLTPDGLASHLLDRVGAGEAERAGAAHHSAACGAESDGLASRILSWLPVDTPEGWASVAEASAHDPANVPDAALEILVAEAAEYAERQNSPPGLMVGAAVREFAERFARHTAEAALAEAYADAELAGVERERDNVDLTCDAGNVQVYTGTSSKSWTDKTSADTPEECEFDLFVFVIPSDDHFKVGARSVYDSDETRACTKADKA
jgi:hypothetical protein